MKDSPLCLIGALKVYLRINSIAPCAVCRKDVVPQPYFVFQTNLNWWLSYQYLHTNILIIHGLFFLNNSRRKHGSYFLRKRFLNIRKIDREGKKLILVLNRFIMWSHMIFKTILIQLIYYLCPIFRDTFSFTHVFCYFDNLIRQVQFYVLQYSEHANGVVIIIHSSRNIRILHKFYVRK